MIFHSSSEFEFTLKTWLQKAVYQFKTGLTDEFLFFSKLEVTYHLDKGTMR